MNIKTIGDLAHVNQNLLVKKFGKHGKMMWEYANGIDNSEVQYIKEKPKSIGNSVTLPIDLIEKEKIEEILLTLTEQVAYRLRKQDLLANSVSIQLRTKNFEDFSHQTKLDCSTASTKEIMKKAKQLLTEKFKNGMAIRLVGLRVDNLVSKEELQISLFQNTEEHQKQEKLDKVIDKLNEKYGGNSITRAGKMNINIKFK